MSDIVETCDECGKFIAECNALSVARMKAESWLQTEGYGGLDARAAAKRLIPHHSAADHIAALEARNARLVEQVREAKEMLTEIDTHWRTRQSDNYLYRLDAFLRTLTTEQTNG